MRLSVDIDPAEVARWLGAMGRPLDASLEARLEDAVAAARRIVAPAGVWRRYPVKGGAVGQDEGEGPAACLPANGCGSVRGRHGTPIGLEGCALELPGRDIARHLSGAASVAVMAVTVGIEADREYRRRAVGSALDALLFSTAAAVAAEAAADALNELIVAEAGCRATTRFSPGYGDLPLSVHPALLASIDATRRLGLTAADSGLLIPAKSITAVIGLFDGEVSAAPSSPSASPCAAHTEPQACAECPNLGRCALAAAGKTCGRTLQRSAPTPNRL